MQSPRAFRFGGEAGLEVQSLSPKRIELHQLPSSGQLFKEKTGCWQHDYEVGVPGTFAQVLLCLQGLACPGWWRDRVWAADLDLEGAVFSVAPRCSRLSGRKWNVPVPMGTDLSWA